MIDYHSHILPGIDDGARTLDEAIGMARVLAAAGCRTVHCTPHCIPGVYATVPGQVREAVAALQAELDAAGVGLRLVPGMEYYLDEYFPEQLERALPLGDSDLLLVEAPGQAHADLLRENLFLARRRGFTPLIAHPERYRWWAPPPPPKSGLWARLRSRRAPQPASGGFPTIDDLHAQGCLLQGNLGSLAGRYGPEVRRRALYLLHAGLYTHFGSDAHRLDGLEGMVKGGKAVIGEAGCI